MPVIGDAALPALGQALADVAPLVRVTAIQALVGIGTEPAHQVLSTHLRDEVYIPPEANRAGFFFDRYPVTNLAYELFLSFNPSYEPPDHWRGRSAPEDLKLHPVVGVSWVDARAYAAWAGKRLPTATEWQVAAGDQNGRRYPWGNEFSTGRANTREGGQGMTTPVGRYSPAGDSLYGAADLAGNVWEWLADEAGVAGQYRQLRGGSWFYSAEFARTDYDRFWRPPEQRQDDIGFRLCFSLTEGA